MRIGKSVENNLWGFHAFQTFREFLTKAEKRYNKELNHTYLSDHGDK